MNNLQIGDLTETGVLTYVAGSTLPPGDLVIVLRGFDDFICYAYFISREATSIIHYRDLVKLA